MWDRLSEAVGTRLLMIRFEDKFERGVPDVHHVHSSGASGWLELKSLVKLPREVPLLRAADFRPEQALWANRYVRHGGRAGLLLRVVENDVWVYWRARAEVSWCSWIRSTATEQVLEAADAVWRGGFDPDELVEALCV